MSTGDELIGQVLQQTYRVERLIGEGGMGVVYEASHLRLPRRFAIKVLSRSVAEDVAALARFQREAQVTSALGHPHILEVIDFNSTPDGAPYIIMELLEGEDLASRLERVGRLSVSQVESILRQTASALDAAHQQGIIHRDLKPHNLFLCRRGNRDDFVKVVDFGASKVAGSTSKLTSTQMLIGTPVYMSPEQAEQKTGAVGHRSDIYSLGVVVFEALTGRPPFAADSIPQLLFKVAFHEPPRLRSLRRDVPPGVDAAVARALAKQPEARFGSATELWEAFTGGAARRTGAEATAITDWVPPVEELPIEEPGVGDPTDARDPGTVKQAASSQAGAPGKNTTLSLGTGELAVSTLSVGHTRRTALIVAGVLALAGLSAIALLLLHSPGRTSGASSSSQLLPGGSGAALAGARPQTRQIDRGVARDPDGAVTAPLAPPREPDGRTVLSTSKPEVKKTNRPRPRPRPKSTVAPLPGDQKGLGDGLDDFETKKDTKKRKSR